MMINSKEKLFSLSNNILTFSNESTPSVFKNFFTPFFTWKDFEHNLNLRPLMTKDRLKLTKFNSKNAEWKISGWKWILDSQTIPASLLQKLIHKHHGHMVDCSRISESVNEFCATLEQIYQTPSAVDAHIYFDVTDHLSDGFQIHFDIPDNLIVQMEGKTKFEVWSNKSFPCYLNNIQVPLKDLPGDPIIDVILEPGDAIFIPRLTYHRARSLTKRLSISFPVAKKEWTFSPDLLSVDRHWVKLNV